MHRECHVLCWWQGNLVKKRKATHFSYYEADTTPGMYLYFVHFDVSELIVDFNYLYVQLKKKRWLLKIILIQKFAEQNGRPSTNLISVVINVIGLP